MPLISVIIPIYNTENYLLKCLDSVLSQTLKDIEVLLINDGSTDGSQKICEEYACKDQRIQVLHTPNQGVSHARNLGLEMAKGEYISFIDSDDWIEKDMIATLYRLIQTNHTDLSTCGYTIEDEKGKVIYSINKKNTCILDKWEAMSSLFKDKHYRYKGNLWDKLYKKEIIDRDKLRFNEQIYYNEDRLFIFQYLRLCQSITYTCSSFYHYIIRNSSVMGTFQKTYNKKMCTFMDAFDIMTVLSETYPDYVKRNLSMDYTLSSISFFTQYSHLIPFHEIRDRLMTIKRNNFRFLSFNKKIECLLRCIKLLIRSIDIKKRNYKMECNNMDDKKSLM